jgi:hypothetical protein
MANINARIVEKDAFDLEATQAGSSEIIDLNGASKFSCQAIYDVQSPSAKTFDDGVIAVFTDSPIDLEAANRGVIGNDILLVGDGALDVDALAAAWNLANPDNEVVVNAGGSEVPDDEAELALAGGVNSEVDLENGSLLIPSHGMPLGLKIRLTTTGTLPAPFLTATDYFVIPVDTNSVQLAASLADALAGEFIEIEDQGSSGGVGTLTAVALAGATVTFQKSNDGQTWVNIQSATSISSDGSVLLSQPNVSYRYFKAVKALTAGVVDLKALVLVVGPAV